MSKHSSHLSPIQPQCDGGCALAGGFGIRLQEQGAGLSALARPWAACSAACTAGEAPALPGSALWTDLTDVELRTRWGKEAGQHCPVVLCAFSERLSQGSSSQWPLGYVFGRASCLKTHSMLF